MTSGSRKPSESDGTPTFIIGRPDQQQPSAPTAHRVDPDTGVAANADGLLLARKFVILLVEDDPAEQSLLERALKRMKVHLDLRVVADGEEALSYLFHKKKFAPPADAPRPDLILLDL